MLIILGKADGTNAWRIFIAHCNHIDQAERWGKAEVCYQKYLAPGSK